MAYGTSGHAPGSSGNGPTPAPVPLASGSKMKFFIAGGVVALAVAYLVIMGMQNSAVYFLTVSELEARGAAAQSQVFRVSGNLVPGTLVRDPGSLGIEFAMADDASRPLQVVYRGGHVPDIIGDDVEIIAEGTLGADGQFVASTVLAKCPSRLESAQPAEHGQTQVN